MSTIEKLSPHPLADLMPTMSDAEFAGFRADIEANGLIDPIVTHDGMILDGRHRYRACVETGVTPRFRPFAGESPVQFVLSAKIARQHLTVSQLAMLATRFLDELRAEARERQGSHGAAPGRPAEHSVAGDTECLKNGRATERAGRIVGVSHATVARAAAVADRAPDLADKVMRGEMTVRAADNALRERELPPPTPTAPKPLTDRQRTVAAAQAKRLDTLVNTLGGYVAGLPALKVDVAVSAVDTEHLAHWCNSIQQAVKSLRRLHADLSASEHA